MTPQHQRAVARALVGLLFEEGEPRLSAWYRCSTGRGTDEDVKALLTIPAVVDLLAAIQTMNTQTAGEVNRQPITKEQPMRLHDSTPIYQAYLRSFVATATERHDSRLDEMMVSNISTEVLLAVAFGAADAHERDALNTWGSLLVRIKEHMDQKGP